MTEVESEFKEVWDDAFAMYQRKTGRDLKNDPILAKLRSTDDLLNHIDCHEQKFSDFRQKKAKLWSVLRGAMRGVELVGKFTMNALTLTPFSYASPALGALLFLVTAAQGVSDVYDTIVDLLSDLKSVTDRLEEYAKATLEPKLRRLIIDILTTLLEIFARSEKLIEKRRSKTYLSITFLSGNKKIEDVKKRLATLIQNETRLIGSLTYSTVRDTRSAVDRSEAILQKTDDTTNRSEKKIEGIASSMNETRREGVEKEEREILGRVLDEKLFIKVQQIHEDISERRLVGTGDWIKSESIFQEWTEEKIPLLWILGGPGAGKSFLSSRIIAHLQEFHSQDLYTQSRVSVAYFYIKEDAQQLRSVNSILKAVAHQLAIVDTVFRNFATNICRFPENLATAKSIWNNLFLRFFSSSQSHDSVAFIVIDGLDEAPRAERERLVDILYGLHQIRANKGGTSCRLQVVVVGRPELLESISSTWGSQVIFIEVSASKNSRDITKYILDRIDRVKVLKIRRIPIQDRRELRANVIKKLEDGANGMFLWVNLMLDQISNTSRPNDIDNALAAAPRGLDRMIRHVLERIASDPDISKPDLNEVLAWVTCARENLTLGEMDTILKLRPPRGEGMPDLEERLREQLASFFTLSRADNLTTEQLQLRMRKERRDSLLTEENDEHHDLQEPVTFDDEDGQDQYESPFGSTRLEFSHASVRDYLLKEGRRETREWPDDLGIGIEVDKVHFHITVTLLDALCDGKHPAEFKGNSLTKYALSHCLDHLQLVDRSGLDMSEKQKIIRPLFTAFNSDMMLEKWATTASDGATTAPEPYGLWSQRWLADDKMNDCIKSWYADEAVSDHGFTPEEINRLQIASSSTAALFRPMAHWCAKKWLGSSAKDDDYPELYVWFLHAYLCLDGAEGPNMPDSTVRLGVFGFGDFSLARLRTLAEFGGIPKSSIWHRRFAKVVRAAGYTSAALKEYNQSLALEEHDSITLDGIASCYGDRKKYRLAIEWEQKALAILTHFSDREKVKGLENLCSWYQEVGDVEGAVRAIRDAILLQPIDTFLIESYIECLHKASRFTEIVEFAESPESLLSAEMGDESLSEILSYPWMLDKFGRAARVLGKSNVIAGVLEKLLAKAEASSTKYKVLRLQYSLTYFRFRHMAVEDQATSLWEELLNRISTGSLEEDSSYYVINTSRVLSQLYYDEATGAEAHGLDFTTSISKLENLAQSKGTNNSAASYNRRDCVIFLGMWHRRNGRSETAKGYFRSTVMLAVDILTDVYPWNDDYGFLLLGRTLRKAGYNPDAEIAMSAALHGLNRLNKDLMPAGSETTNNAGASITLRTKRADSKYTISPQDQAEMKMYSTRSISNPLDNSDSSNAPSSVPHAPEQLIITEPDSEDQRERDDDDSWCRCDGQCSRSKEDWVALYLCDVCSEVWFCDQCVETIKNNKLGFRICNPDHSFWRVWPFDRRLFLQATEEVDGRVVPRASWLKGLKEEWEL